MRRSTTHGMPRFDRVFATLLAVLGCGLPCTVLGEVNGFIHCDGRALFPLGIYELPSDDVALQAMADAGLNLVRCHSRADLDRVAARRMMGWVPVGVQAGVTDKLRQSLYALTSELAALQRLLVAPTEKNVRVNVIARDYGQQRLGVRGVARRVGEEWLIILVNEDDTPHMAVEVTGLESLNGRQLDLLYSPDGTTIRHGELIARMQPHAVQIFATGRQWETARRNDPGRSYAGDGTPDHPK